MNEVELSEYCRAGASIPSRSGLWREACERANDRDRAASRQIARETKDAQQRIRDLERDLTRKEKALAEAAALMVPAKKADAIWGRNEGEDE